MALMAIVVAMRAIDIAMVVVREVE